MKTSFKKLNEDTYVVSVDGREIGKLTKTWHRSGGNGWSSPGLNHQLGKTRQEAARKLIKSLQVPKTLCEVLKPSALATPSPLS